ncbi:MAG: xanthine phosphoribosyltransferase [Christensenellales bacterium]|jgi:xanthine phosphoribosyltransferase|nr:xanthine phosphoribosyltransferase [Christensenellaceae bacterium]
MEELKRAVLEKGIVVSNDILKVDMFLNHRIDTKLALAMGNYIADYFRNKRPNIILTIEASGIAIAITTAIALGNIPVVFAKKAAASNQGTDRLHANVHSFTKNKDYAVSVERDYLPNGSRVLIVDDFLANGEAMRGLIKITEYANCTLCGAAVAIEKAFQSGGRELRNQGVDLLSLCKIKSIENGKIVLED